MTAETPSEGPLPTNTAPTAGIGTSEFKSLVGVALPLVVTIFGKDVSQAVQITAIITLGAVAITFICQRGFIKR